ncbi:MAG: SpoIID/LytB domain-containing protein [Phycisphaerae bacterium]
MLLTLLATQPGCKPRPLVRPTPQMDIEPRFWIRVLLLDNVTDCTLETASPFSVTGAEPDPQISTTQDRFTPAAAGATKVEISDGRITIAGRPFTSDELIAQPDDPHIFSLNGDGYRGKLEFRINPDGRSFDVINLVPLEPYLAGVVGAEMPDYWEPEALKAQAIAARTYCLYIKNRFGNNRHWDVTKTQANQVYLGVKAESAQVWSSVNDTYGQVLVCKHPDGTEDIFPTYYSSICAGHTENSEHVFGDSFEPLVGVACPYCKDVAKLGLFFWPMAQFDKTTVQTKLFQKYPTLRRLREITNIMEAEKSDYGRFSRLTKVKLVDSAGKSDFLRAEDLRLTIDPTGRKIKSTICRIVEWNNKWAFLAGRGWGHGVGMCQCGAQGLAREGKTAREILYYYYPSSKIVRVY